MSKLGKKLIAAAREGVAIARGKAARTHVPRPNGPRTKRARRPKR
jgi:hypothetical protein